MYQTALPVGPGRDGTVLVPAGGNAIDPEGLDAVDMETGDRRWTTQEWAESSLAVVADDRVLIAGADDMRSLSLADGKETAGRRSFEGWPEDEAPKAMLVSGGVVFLAFPDGTVLTAHVP
ncbi:hypothetical protein SSPS47_18770 [Streptomyces sp. S4.7]|uniref:hypothetical protein n=1 Tax=Streptomyces sp. S4.7 TaxID=2705439 RepID=UPI001396FE5E|nr:hypothetical protein [Streptomyces sp. S4.7]QHY97153.1 hypothetical protein SSPS47_18770 [Streptomyces sp. S4.7]